MGRWRVIATIPEATLKAFADHGEVRSCLPADGGDANTVLGEFAQAAIDVSRLADRLQQEGAAAFVQSWNDLLSCLHEKSLRIMRAS